MPCLLINDQLIHHLGGELEVTRPIEVSFTRGYLAEPTHGPMEFELIATILDHNQLPLLISDIKTISWIEGLERTILTVSAGYYRRPYGGRGELRISGNIIEHVHGHFPKRKVRQYFDFILKDGKLL